MLREDKHKEGEVGKEENGEEKGEGTGRTGREVRTEENTKLRETREIYNPTKGSSFYLSFHCKHAP